MGIDWATRVTSLNGLSLAGADAENRSRLVTELTGKGTPYDSARAALGATDADTAKSAGDAAFAASVAAWAVEAQPAHERADAMARYILGGGAPIAFATDGSAEGALDSRLADAKDFLASIDGTAKLPLATDLATHVAYTARIYGQRPKVPEYAAGTAYTRQAPGLLVYGAGKWRGASLRDYERATLQPLIDEADLLILELAFT